MSNLITDVKIGLPKDMQTLLFHKFIRPELIEYTDSGDEEIKINRVLYPIYLPFRCHASRIKFIDRPYKIIYIEDFCRYHVGVCTDIYPLNGVFWKTFYWLEILNHNIQGKVYFFLRERLNDGKDFIPDTELVGHWVAMFKQFFRYKFLDTKN